MASQSPEPRSLKSWQEAFQYPIPTVRRMEQELRRDIASNKEKLRALVGTRYRELLGTAETIVAMNRDIQEVESNLTDVGRRSNPRLIEKTYTHFNQVKSDVLGRDAETRSFGAQLALLHRCTTSMSKLLRKRGPLLLIAKLVVVSRLLHKTLSQQKTVPPFLESLRTQLGSLRRTLLKRTDRRLASAHSAAEDIVQALAAYCLATSSSSDDAIRHFHQVRVEVIGSQLDSADLSGENILKAFKLYIKTFQTSKTLLSRRLSDVLGKLKSRPILTDPEIRNLDDLDIDVLGRWVATDVSNFTPWIKLSELTKSEAEKTLKQWSADALQTFVKGCEKSLAEWADFSELLSLRHETLKVWLSSRSSTPTHSPLSVLEDIRSLFNGQLTRVLHAQAKKLEDLARDVSSIVSNWESVQRKGAQSLWDSGLISLDYSNGALTFKQVIVDRLLGRDGDISAVVRSYQAWLESIENSRKLVDDLRRVKWIDMLDGGEDEDPDVDITAILNEDDPKILLDGLKLAVRQALDSLQSSFSDTVGSFGSSNQSAMSGFMLRFIRQIRRDMPSEFMPRDFVISRDIVPELQKILVAEVVTNTGPLTLSGLNSHHSQKVPGRTLWEGDPELPVQPSPSTFKFLRRLMTSMEQCGSDLWDPSTVEALKNATTKELSTSIISVFENLDSSLPAADKETASPELAVEGQATNNGDSNTEQSKSSDIPGAEVLRDRKIQLLFDTIYLADALAIRVRDAEKSELSSVVDKIQNSVDPNMEITKSIKRTADGYWKRTELLFGLLAVRTD